MTLFSLLKACVETLCFIYDTLYNTFSFYIPLTLDSAKIKIKIKKERKKERQRKNLYLPLAVFIAKWLVGLSKQLKQMIQIEQNIVKNPNWETNQLAWRGRGFELVATVKQIQVVARAGLEPGIAGLRVRRADHSATLHREEGSGCHLHSFHDHVRQFYLAG